MALNLKVCHYTWVRLFLLWDNSSCVYCDWLNPFGIQTKSAMVYQDFTAIYLLYFLSI